VLCVEGQDVCGKGLCREYVGDECTDKLGKCCGGVGLSSGGERDGYRRLLGLRTFRERSIPKHPPIPVTFGQLLLTG
jgi:hypothetical protein